jgi:hypothetical protein
MAAVMVAAGSMGLAVLIIRGLFAVVFVTAACAKVLSLGATRASLVDFGLPRALSAPGAVLLVVSELVVAGLLIPTSTAVAAAVAAVVMLAAFTAAIGWAMARGQQVACNCFGAVSARPVGVAQVIRNLVLMAGAVVVVAAGPGDTVGAALTGVDGWAAVGLVALIAVLALVGWFGYQLFRQNARLLARIEALEQGGAGPLRSGDGGLAVGQLAPAFSLMDLSGRACTLGRLLEPGLPLALAFSDPNCGACGPMLPRLAQLRAARDGELTIALITSGGAGEARERVNGFVFDAVLLQQRREVVEAYQVGGVPSAVLIDPTGKIAAPVAIGRDAIERLLGHPASHLLADPPIEVITAP